MRFGLIVLSVALACGALTACGGAETSRDISRGDGASNVQLTKAPAAKAADSGPLRVGMEMPSYSATTIDGAKYDLKEKRGKVLLLNIWATWCPPCRAETPDLVKLHEKYKGRGFEVVGVSIDEAGNAQQVRTFAKDYKVSYPVVYDPDGKIADMFATAIIPTSALVDRNGRITWIMQGMVELDDREAIAAIESALGS
jgi:peroxiredoxin